VKTQPTAAMILAAGMGTRLRPLTETCPKPMIEVGGQPMVFRIIKTLVAKGFKSIVINTHHFADMMEAKIKAAQQQGQFGVVHIVFSREAELLETGGGLKAALPLLATEPVLVVNSDAIWDDARTPLIAPLMQAWANQPEHTQALLAVVPTARTQAFQPQGDFLLEEGGTLNRDGERATFGHIYAGVHITEVEKIAAFGMAKFSLNLIWEAMRAEHGLKGFAYDAPWCEMGTLAGLERARALLGEAP
jgi:N-acetyl-alpha-D-muramate 1-phosphate uridylyltransferase